MKYAGRFNSLVFKGQDVLSAIDLFKSVDGITHLEFNYPEHLASYDPDIILERMGHLKVNGLAVRWRKDFLSGNFTNPDRNLREKAVHMAFEACDLCRKLGGKVITLWLENDGFDYPFQINYEDAFREIVEAVRAVCDYAPDLKISIEYKPYEERNFALIDSVGMTLYLLEKVDRENIGCTLDFCHMLMKHDSPSYGLALAASSGKLCGLHMNDGYGVQDSGLIFGSVNFSMAAEFIFYLLKYGYDGVVFFDTFPMRENGRDEIQANIETFELIIRKVEKIGVQRIEETLASRDGIKANRLIYDLLQIG